MNLIVIRIECVRVVVVGAGRFFLHLPRLANEPPSPLVILLLLGAARVAELAENSVVNWSQRSHDGAPVFGVDEREMTHYTILVHSSGANQRRIVARLVRDDDDEK